MEYKKAKKSHTAAVLLVTATIVISIVFGAVKSSKKLISSIISAQKNLGKTAQNK